jgi:hypothetical protein
MKARITAMLGLFETALIEEFLRVPMAAIRGMAKLRGGLACLFNGGRR